MWWKQDDDILNSDDNLKNFEILKNNIFNTGEILNMFGHVWRYWNFGKWLKSTQSWNFEN